MTMDLPEGYSIPIYIVAIDQRPETVLWNNDQKTLTMVELTFGFETSQERRPIL